MIHEIPITQEMIDRSSCGNPSYCVISQALQTMYTNLYVRSYSGHSFIFKPPMQKTPHITYSHSEEVRSYIFAFDYQHKVKPCILLVDDEQFTLDIK